MISSLLYATPTWADRVIKFTICRNAMIRTQWIAAPTQVYCTVSANAALRGDSPEYLLAPDRKKICSKINDPDRTETVAEVRRVERDITLLARTNRWNLTDNSASPPTNVFL